MIFNITPYSIVANFNAVGEPSRTEQLKGLKKKKKSKSKVKKKTNVRKKKTKKKK